MRVPGSVDVKAIRSRQKLSQGKFSQQFGFPIASIRNWEQGRRELDSAARLLLAIIDLDPHIVRRALQNYNPVEISAKKKSGKTHC